MSDLLEIRRANRAAALRAAKQAKCPLVIGAIDIEDYRAGDREALNLPCLGNGKVEGWRCTGSFLVHKVEALTHPINYFGVAADGLQYADAFKPGYGHGVIFELPFQRLVGVFERETAI
jgi:hypothetical protein